MTKNRGASRLPWHRFLLATAGPGLVVMLADTDAGSIITAAQSGVAWGYSLLLLQFLLIPVLYIVQELTVRLGLVTRRGHGELIQQRFGKAWAWFSVATLAVACIGALLTELSGLAGVGALFGVPVSITMALTVTTIIAIVLTGSHRAVERVALLLGLFELAFVWVAWRAGAQPAQTGAGMLHLPLGDRGYLYLVAANIGAVIMPWMIFYQQSAIAEKGPPPDALPILRWETLIGAVMTQLIMAAVLLATAATIGRVDPDARLDTVQQISDALTPFLGGLAGHLAFALGMSGSALVATIVVSLTAAWGVGEVAGYRHSLEHHPGEAPWFYGIFALCLVLAAALVSSGIDLIALSLAVQVLNALLLPIVLGFLVILARSALPAPYRLEGAYGIVVVVIALFTAGFAVWAGLSSLL